jgi:acyl-coenzyme A synthetase/AMP-(fatty) acid ligase
MDVIEESAPNCRELKHIIAVSYPQAGRVSKSHLDFAQLIDDSVSLAGWQPADTANDDVAFIAYTSGTTGDPKGVVHYHRYPIAYKGLVRYWHDYRKDDVVACPSELGWLLPVASTFLYAFSRGLTVVLFDAMGQRFDPLAWFRLFQKHRITNFTAPPTVYRMLMTVGEEASQFDLSSLRHAVTAGEPLPPDTLEAIRQQLGLTPLDGIGMSECMVYCYNMVGMPLKPGSCGRPGPGTVIQLMDEEMNTVPQGAEGILCLKRDTHPGMMKEYWNKPDRTAEVFRGEWYVSGDVLSMDADGYYWFKGRADDVIKASGYRVSPFEVESCLLEHPAILEAAAVASPDPLRGTVIKAFIVPRAGYEPGDALRADVQEFVKRSVAPYKCPRKLEFITALPKTTSGKVKRNELRQREHEQGRYPENSSS